MVVVVDSEDRENEGDLVIAGQFATPDAVNFMITHGRGLVCLALTEDRCEQLGLTQMVRKNEAPLATAFTEAIEAREGTTTGISAPDRSRTIMVAIDPDSSPSDLVKPGHVFPLRAKPGGVLERAGHTEAAVDLARMAGLIPAGGRTASAACSGNATLNGPYSLPRNPAVVNAFSSSPSPRSKRCPMLMNAGIAGSSGPRVRAIHAPRCGAATVCGGT